MKIEKTQIEKIETQRHIPTFADKVAWGDVFEITKLHPQFDAVLADAIKWAEINGVEINTDDRGTYIETKSDVMYGAVEYFRIYLTKTNGGDAMNTELIKKINQKLQNNYIDALKERVKWELGVEYWNKSTRAKRVMDALMGWKKTLGYVPEFWVVRTSDYYYGSRRNRNPEYDYRIVGADGYPTRYYYWLVINPAKEIELEYEGV